jgi:hypothetical protein
LSSQEAALQDAIDGMAGPLSLVKEVLAEAAATATAAAGEGGGAAETVAQHNGQLASPGISSSSLCNPDGSNGSVAGAVDRSGESFSSRLPPTACYKHTDALLQRLNTCEGRVQGALQLLGCVSDHAGYRQLYTTQLLRTAVSHPDVMAGYLNMPKNERLQYWANVSVIHIAAFACSVKACLCLDSLTLQ